MRAQPARKGAGDSQKEVPYFRVRTELNAVHCSGTKCPFPWVTLNQNCSSWSAPLTCPPSHRLSFQRSRFTHRCFECKVASLATALLGVPGFWPSGPLCLPAKSSVSVMVWKIAAALKRWRRGVSLPRCSPTCLTCSVKRDANKKKGNDVSTAHYADIPF